MQSLDLGVVGGLVRVLYSADARLTAETRSSNGGSQVNTMMRVAVAAIVGAAAIAMGPTSSTANAVATPSPSLSASPDARGFYIASSDDETFADAVNAAALRGTQQSELIQTLKDMKKNLQQGKSLKVPDGTRMTPATTAIIDEALTLAESPDAARLIPAPPTSRIVTHPNSTSNSSSAVTVAAALDTNNPNTWPQRGSKGSGSTFWTGTQLALNGDYCNMGGCIVEDFIRISVTTNPGAQTNKLSGTLSYVHNPVNGEAPLFQDIFVRTWNMCDASVKCGLTDNTDKRTTWYSTNTTRMNSRLLLHGHQLFAKFKPDMLATKTDQATTGSAKCNAISIDNVCKYL